MTAATVVLAARRDVGAGTRGPHHDFAGATQPAPPRRKAFADEAER